MLGSNKDFRKSDSEFSKTRCGLILKTAGFKIISSKIKERYRIETLSSYEQKNKLTIATLGINLKLKKELEEFAKFLRVNVEFLEDAISGWVDKKGLDFTSLPIYIANGEPFADGFYIRVDTTTRKVTALKAFEYIKFILEDIQRYSTYIGPKITIVKRDKKISNFLQDFRLFEHIEQAIWKKWLDLKDSKQSGEDSKSFVNDLIKYASEELFGKVRFPESKKRYYSLLRYYQVPTFTKFEKFLVRPPL